MSDEPIALKIFNNEVEAGLAQHLLADAGVKAFILKDDGGGMEPHLQLTGGVRLMVNNADIERAQKLLQNLTSN